MRVGTVYNSLPNFYSKGDFFLCLLQVGSAALLNSIVLTGICSQVDL